MFSSFEEHAEDEMQDEAVPKKYLSDQNFRRDVSRFEVDFSMEIESMNRHSGLFNRPFLGQLVNKVYINKFKGKSYVPWVYAGETKDNYFNYRSFQTSSKMYDSIKA
jgi:hypothetical protein